jgi:Uma2 family endonuclease
MIAKRKLTVSDFLRMAEVGLFAPAERVELLDGEIYAMSPPSSRHIAWVNRVMKALERSSGDYVIVQVQSPVRLSEDSAPEPDVAVLAPRDDFYESGLPGAADIYLVVEVSVATLHHDRTVKLSAYARAGVPEYWIVNVDEAQLEVYREPRGDHYRMRLLLSLGEAVTPLAVPGAAALTF